MRLILVVNGAKSEKKRALVSERLLSWGLREFKRVTLARPGEVLEMANTWLGEENTVGLTVSEDINLILEQAKVASVKAEVVYKGPIEAPIKKGQVLGKLLISIPGKPAIERALVAMKDVQKVGPFKRVLSALSHIIWGQS